MSGEEAGATHLGTVTVAASRYSRLREGTLPEIQWGTGNRVTRPTAGAPVKHSSWVRVRVFPGEPRT